MNQFSVYSAMPVFVQNWLCSLKGKKIESQRYGGAFKEYFDFLQKSDHWSHSEIISYKERELADILNYAYNHCRFYRKKFDEAGVKPQDFKKLSDIEKFPVLTKEEVRANWKEMISDEFCEGSMIKYHTSGSTGKALDFYWTLDSLRFYWAVVWRGRKRFGIEKGDLHLNFTGKIVVPLSQNKPPYWRYNKSLNQYMLNMQHITQSKIQAITDFINEKKAKFFVGYPSIINSLAGLILENGLKVTAPPRFIFSSAEKMYDFQRINIEKAFPGVRIIEHYGFSENAGAASKNVDGLYHEDFEMGHLELQNPITLDDGSMRGTLLATGFKNLGMPFIRYEIGDTATFAPDNAISDIEGRNGDYVITPEGAQVMRFGYIFKETDAIKECQIVQKKLGEMIVRIVPRPDYDKNRVESEVTSLIRQWISLTIDVKFEYVDRIERTKSGKFKAVVSELL